MLADIPDDHQHKDMANAIKHCRAFGLALDCGAHRGVVTRLLLEHFDRVVSIEPSELAERIDARARVIRACVGAEPARVGMAHGKENTGQRHVIDGDQYDVITIDSLNLTPDFLKLDVEGMEFHAIVGAEQTIRAHRPVVILEENGLNRRYGVRDGAAGRLLESWGARLVQVLNKDFVYSW